MIIKVTKPLFLYNLDGEDNVNIAVDVVNVNNVWQIVFEDVRITNKMPLYLDFIYYQDTSELQILNPDDNNLAYPVDVRTSPGIINVRRFNYISNSPFNAINSTFGLSYNINDASIVPINGVFTFYDIDKGGANNILAGQIINQPITNSVAVNNDTISNSNINIGIINAVMIIIGVIIIWLLASRG